MVTMNIDAAKVFHVYSGKHGCACGCRGKHTYTKDGAEKRATYDVTVNDRVVAQTVAKMNELIALGQTPDVDSDYIAVETDTRLYIAYLW